MKLARAAAFVLTIVSPLTLSAQTAASQGSRWQLTWNPATDLYAPYAADPRRSRHIVAIVSALQSDLPDSQGLRWSLAIGGTYGVARLARAEAMERAWQLEIEARFYAQFDVHHALDEIGHDGRVGAILVKGFTPDLAARLSLIHTSSHLGDEYILRNDVTERPALRREELGVGLSWRPTEHVRTYADAGYGLNLNPGTAPLRLQSGIDFVDRPRLGTSRWYVALDATAFEENDFEISANLQTGLLLQSKGSDRKYRIGVELYDGRSQLDAFYRYRERYLVVGLWLDL